MPVYCPSCGPIMLRQTDLQLDAIRNFKPIRDAFVVELEKLSGGDTGGRAVVLLQAFLRRIYRTLSLWTMIRWGSSQEGTCFENKCGNLMVLVDEISAAVPHSVTTITGGNTYIEDPVMMKTFDMLAMQIGSLTLQGWSRDDTEAVQNARMVEGEQRRWEQKPECEDDERRRLLRHLWSRLYFRLHDCSCRQCMDFFMPRRDPTPSPPLPPMSKEEDELDECHSLFSEEE